MNILKLKNVFYVFITLLLIGVTITSCEKEISKNSQLQHEFSTNQGLSTKTLDEFYNHLSNQKDIAQMDMSDKLVTLKEYAESENIEFDLQRAIERYENGLNKIDLTKGDIFVQNQYDVIFSILTQYGLNDELKFALDDYRKELINGATNSKIDVRYYNKVLERSWRIEYMATSEAFHNYLKQMPDGIELLKNNTNIQARGWWDCVLATLDLAQVLIKCAGGDYLACLDIPEATTDVANECGGGDEPVVDPCENNPNPCCGISCIQGYECIDGNCVFDPWFDNCDNCLPGEECVDGYCQPF